jgi:hypothetical protein
MTESATVTATNAHPYKVGNKVERIGTQFPSWNGTTGEIVAVTDERVQIQWHVGFAGGKPRKGWMQVKAHGKKWRLLPGVRS